MFLYILFNYLIYLVNIFLNILYNFFLERQINKQAKKKSQTLYTYTWPPLRWSEWVSNLAFAEFQTNSIAHQNTLHLSHPHFALPSSEAHLSPPALQKNIGVNVNLLLQLSVRET